MIGRRCLVIEGTILAFGLCLVVADETPCQTAEGEAHQWVVLLDESSSVLSVEGRISASGSQPRSYSVRAELMTLLEAMIAARSRTLGVQRTDELTVFHFGRGVRRAERQGLVSWDNLSVEEDWRLNVDRQFRQQTWLNEALYQALDFFAQFPGNTKRHLVIISDGELDVGRDVRRAGQPPGDEELTEYRESLLNPRSELHEGLARLEVEVTALVLDTAFTALSDRVRRQQLHEEIRSADGTNDLTRTMALIEDWADGAPLRGHGEGPYVMLALANQHRGQPRFVTQANVHRVLWETLFPDQALTRGLVARNATRAVVFAPKSVPVPVTVTYEGDARDVRLTWRLNDSGHDRSPDDIPLEVQAKPTTNYVTWIVESDSLVALDVTDEAGVWSMNNLDLEWTRDSPPAFVPLDRVVPIELELRWVSHRPGWSPEEWRRAFADELADVRASAIIDEPNGDSAYVQLRPEVGHGDPSTVLTLRGVFDRPRTEGTHLARATVEQRGGTGEHTRPSVLARFVAASLEPTAPELFIVNGQRWSQLASLEEAAPTARLRLPASVELASVHRDSMPAGAPLLIDSVGIRQGAGTEWVTASPRSGDISQQRRFGPLTLEAHGRYTARLWVDDVAFDYFVVVEPDRSYALYALFAVLLFLLGWWVWSAAPWAPDYLEVLDRTSRRRGRPEGRPVLFTARSDAVAAVSRWEHPLLLWLRRDRLAQLRPDGEGGYQFVPGKDRTWFLSTRAATEWSGVEDLEPPDDHVAADHDTVDPGGSTQLVVATAAPAFIEARTLQPALDREGMYLGEAVVLRAAGCRWGVLVKKKAPVR